MSEVKEEYKNVAIFGQGYVGLPLSLSFALRGCNVYGVDVVEKLVNEINNGITYHTEKFEDKGIREILNDELKNKRYRATLDFNEAMDVCNNIIVTVGIPIKNGEYELSDLLDCCRKIGKKLKKGDLIVIRSTVIPGTTEEIILPALEEESHMKAGKDFFLAYSSERIAEGKAFEEFAYMPTVVAGINSESAKRAKELLSVVCKTEIITASCIKVVETSKVFENVQRDVNIAMVQEFARFCEAIGIDTFEVVNVANTHKRVKLLTPGPGVGGYCIPNAYYYIEPKAKEVGVSLDILKLCRHKNEMLPETIVDMLDGQAKSAGKELKNMKVGILGIAMKDYSNDDRISPPIEIAKVLKNRCLKVEAYDPVVPSKYDFKVNSLKQAVSDKDAVMILAKQKEFDDLSIDDLIKSLKPGTIVLDTRNLFSKYVSEFEKNNIIYKSL